MTDRNIDAKAIKAAKIPVGPKRPLNSFMAFRKYYGASLTGLTQKAISKIVVLLWRNDPLKAKWAMLAKAYSILRGNKEKEEVPLSDFFDMCAPMVGVIPANQYMAVMGWHISIVDRSNEKRLHTPLLVRLFVPDFEEFPDSITTTIHSVGDIVNYATAMGLTGDAVASGFPDDSAVESFSMIVQPASTHQLLDHDLATAHQAQSLSHNFDAALESTQAGQHLSAAVKLVDQPGAPPYPAFFDPSANDVMLMYDPTMPRRDLADHGRFEAYYLEGHPSREVEGSQAMIDISDYVYGEAMGV